MNGDADSLVQDIVAHLDRVFLSLKYDVDYDNLNEQCLKMMILSYLKTRDDVLAHSEWTYAEEDFDGKKPRDVLKSNSKRMDLVIVHQNYEIFVELKHFHHKYLCETEDARMVTDARGKSFWEAERPATITDDHTPEQVKLFFNFMWNSQRRTLDFGRLSDLLRNAKHQVDAYSRRIPSSSKPRYCLVIAAARHKVLYEFWEAPKSQFTNQPKFPPNQAPLTLLPTPKRLVEALAKTWGGLSDDDKLALVEKIQDQKDSSTKGARAKKDGTNKKAEKAKERANNDNEDEEKNISKK